MFNRNPTVILNGLSEFTRLILPLLVVVGLVHISPEKLAGTIAIISLTIAFISTTILKSQVTSNETSDQLVREGIRSGKDTSLAQVKEKVEVANNG